MRIYIDTSVIGGCFDEEFSAPSKKLLNLKIITMKKKKFDSVKMMRDIRDKLSKRWAENPEQEITDLERIRSKYRIRKRTKKHAA